MFSKLSNEAVSPVVPAPREAEVGGLLQPRRGGWTWATEPHTQPLLCTSPFEFLLSDIILSKHSKRALHTFCCQEYSFCFISMLEEGADCNLDSEIYPAVKTVNVLPLR